MEHSPTSSLSAPSPSPPFSSSVQPPTSPKDPVLDFFSPDFDACKAIYTFGLRPPIPNAKILDNIGQCIPLIPPSALPANTIKERKVLTDEERAARDQKEREREDKMIAAIQERQRELELIKQRDKFKLDQKLQDTKRTANTPLQLVQQCFVQKKRVKVVLRGAVGVRGSCTGLIRAFDKHLNLVLLDAEERFMAPHYEPIISKEGSDAHYKAEDTPTVPGETRKKRRKRRKNENPVKKSMKEHVRCMRQLFVRGDGIVLITPIS